MKNNLLLLCCIILAACSNSKSGKTENDIDNESIEFHSQKESEDTLVNTNQPVTEADHSEYDPKTTLYFSHALIYKYWDETQPDSEGELWMRYNPETQNVLFVPDDEMIDFVVSSPDGNYYFFGNDGHGELTVSHQHVDWVTNNYDESATYPVSDSYVKFSKTNRIIKVENFSLEGKPIKGDEYQWEFQKIAGKQLTAVTEQIPINFYQIYGFNKLDGDIQLPVNYLDFVGIFGKNQTIIRHESEPLHLELIAYESNPYFAEAGDYKFAIYKGDGNWEEKHLPLLKK